MTGDPAWQAGARSGSGDLLEADMQSEELLVSGNARMRLPAREFAAPAVAGPSITNVSGRVGSTADTNQFAEIRCAEYRASRTGGRFSGGVAIDHPQMHWDSDVVTVRFPPEGGTADQIVGHPARFALFNPEGTIEGQGREAVYSHAVSGGKTNSILTLKGQPATLTMTNGLSVASSSLVFDLATSTFVVPRGKYEILMPKELAIDTNAFRFPRDLGAGAALPSRRK